MTTSKKKKKSARERRVLVASIICAGLIVAGSTFAWFSSSDEVTNRLSASADYGVTIAEDFTPPENWLPGQKIDKNVGVVNTGNVDAFVRTWLEGEMNLLAEKRDTVKASKTTPSTFSGGSNNYFTNASVFTKGDGSTTTDSITNLNLETDDDLKKLGLTYYYGNYADGSKVSLKELSTNTYLNPNNPTVTVSSPDGYSDVMAVQAGGELVYADTSANTTFYFTPNQTMSFKSELGHTYDVVGGTKYKVTVNTISSPSGDDILVSGTDITVKDLAALYKYIGDHIDTNTFYPASTGLYIFRRNVDMNANGYPDYEFTGYYYVSSTTEDGTLAKQGKYFALQYENDNSQRSDYVLEKDTYTIARDNTGLVTFYPYVDQTGTYSSTKVAHKVDDKWYGEDGFEVSSGDVTNATDINKSITLFTAKQQVLENSKLTWTYATKALDDGQEIEDNGVVYTWNATGSKWVDASGNDVTADSELDKKLDAAATGLATLTATYYGAENSTTGAGLLDGYVLVDTTGKITQSTADDINIVINLNNINNSPNSAETAETWTAVAATANTYPITFYYNNDLEEGATTKKLVDSVEMSQDTTQQAYLAFDFDLNVFMDSVQVTTNDNGKEAFESVNPWADDGGNGNTAVAATGTHTSSPAQDNSEIVAITWTQYTPSP